MCFRCGRIGHGEEACGFVVDLSNPEKGRGRVLSDSMIVDEGKGSMDRPCPLVQESGRSARRSQPKLGPWQVTSRVLQPHAPRVPARGGRDQRSPMKGAESLDPCSSSPLVPVELFFFPELTAGLRWLAKTDKSGAAPIFRFRWGRAIEGGLDGRKGFLYSRLAWGQDGG